MFTYTVKVASSGNFKRAFYNPHFLFSIVSSIEKKTDEKKIRKPLASNGNHSNAMDI